MGTPNGLAGGLRSGGAQLARAAEIAAILSASSFGWMAQALGLVHRGKRRPPAQGWPVSMPERLRLTLERLGPAFVKAGQMLAVRPDYVPMEYAEALRGLHTGAAAFAATEAAAIIEAELGAPPASLYAEFEQAPFAAASLSQVHRARLHDGRRVAVKIQRPGIQRQVERDLALLATLARGFERHQTRSIAFRPSEAVAELSEYTRRELDFRKEARTAQQLREMFAGDDQVVIPAVIRDRSTARVLTTEFLDGHPPAPAADLQRAGLNPAAALRAGAAAMLRQIFEFGLFHADPHPGNVLLLPGDRIGFVDFGMFGRLDPRERRRMAAMFWALIAGDYEAVGGQLLRLSDFLPGADPDGFRTAFADTVEEWFGRSAAEFSVPRLLLHELALGGRHGIVFPRGLMLLSRALVTLEATAMIIDPQLNLAELARPLLPELRHILLPTPHAVREHWQRHRFDYLQFAIEFPALLPEAVARLREGPTRPPPPSPPAAAHPRTRQWLSVGGAFAAGAGLATLAHKRRHT